MSIRQTEFVNTIIKAGAGAGKTYGLIHKIVDLVREYTQHNEKQLPRFVVTTFTRKATQEVKERLLMKALELQQSEPEFGALFTQFLRGSGSLLISTIHGVLNQFLREHGYRIGLDPDFELAPPSDLLLTQVLHKMLEDEESMAELVRHFGWRRLKYFFLNFHRSSVFNPALKPIEAEAFLAHWKKEMEQLKHDCETLLFYLAEPLAQPKKSEALSRLESALKTLSKAIEPEANIWDLFATIKNENFSYPASMGNMAKWSDSAKELKKRIGEKIKVIRDDPWRIKSYFEDHLLRQERLEPLGRVFSQLWLKTKIAENKIELEDLELLSLYILRQFPDCALHFSEAWDYWFIDEYQDTSPIQVELLQFLIGKSPHYIVGDPQQSIYFFRGARSKVFNEKLEHFENNSHRVEIKTINRRSFAPTLHFINELMDRVNPHQFQSMDPLPEKNLDESLVGHFYLHPSEDHERLKSVGSALRKILNQGSTSPSSIAILCRENKEIYQLFSYLRAEGFPCEIFSQGEFHEDRHVRDALALWNFLTNPFDDINLVELLRSPWFCCPDEILFQAAQHKKASLWLALRDLALKDENLPVISQLENALLALNDQGHIEVWEQLIIESNLLRSACSSDHSGRTEGNLWKLMQNINLASKNGTLTLSDPLNFGTSTETNSKGEAKAIRSMDQIKLLTIHASKGLEFDHVLLPFLNHSSKKEAAEVWNTDIETKEWSMSLVDSSDQSAHPSSLALENIELVNQLLAEESERLFYVAITRSKHTLHFFIPEETEKISKSGWASFLQPYLEKGEGLFKSEKSSYEFEVVKFQHDVDLKPNAMSSTVQESILHPMEHPSLSMDVTEAHRLPTSSLPSTTGRETSLCQLPQKPIETISHGIREHRYFEAYSSSKGQVALPKNLNQYIDTAPFPLRELLEEGNQEWPFAYLKVGQLVEGRIDLWGRLSNGELWIVDFKTGSSRFSQSAFKQLREYAMALWICQQVQKKETVHLAICYTREGLFMTEKIEEQTLSESQ